ncbi:MAG: hypothetical protein ACT4QC_20580 [Planctomycetaceae bacterium]
MKVVVRPALAILLLLGMATLAAAEEKKSVDGILESYAKAIGGQAAWNKLESRRVIGELVAGDSTSKWTLEAKLPNKQVMRMELPGLGPLEEGYDGKSAWSKSQAGVRAKEGDELQRAAKQADFRREFRLKELYPGLAYKGTESLNGEEVEVLECAPSSTSKERFSFSEKSGLLLRQQSEFQTDGNQLTLEVDLSDYREVDGIKYPHSQETKVLVGGQVLFGILVKVKEIRHQEKIDDAAFSKPAG